jgi:protein archease
LEASLEFEHFDHAADVGVRGFGATPADAFENTAAALFALLAEDLSTVRRVVEERFELEAPGLPELLVAFLNELISIADARQLVFGSFSVDIERRPASYHLAAVAWGEPFDPDRHQPTVQPKGATYTALRVSPEAGRWVAQCVVDV